MKMLAITKVALLRFLRERSNIFFVFLMPLAIVVLIGMQFGGQMLPSLGIYVEDGSELADRIVDLLEDGAVIETSRNGSVAETRVYNVDYRNQENDLIRAVERGGVDAGVSIPAGLDELVGSGGLVEVGFVTRSDGYGPQFQVTVSEAVLRAQSEMRAVRFAVSKGADPVVAENLVPTLASAIGSIEVVSTVKGESWFPAGMGRFDLGAQTMLILWMFLTGLSGSAVLIQTRRYGVARRMIGTPTSVATIVGGEALGRFSVVLVQGLYIMAATTLLFAVGWGDPLGAAAIVVVFALVSGAAAMLLGALFRNDEQAGGVAPILGIGLAALGGSMMPAEFFPAGLLKFSKMTPHYWANDAFAQLVRHNGSVADILPHLGILMGYALVFGILGAVMLRRVLTH